MSNLDASIVLGLMVGPSLLAGAVVAGSVDLAGRIAAIVTSLGGGLLLAAVAFELAPEADVRAGTALTSTGLVGGMLTFDAADAWLSRDETMQAVRRSSHAAAAGQPMTMSHHDAQAARGEAIAAGLFVDGVPESVALGLTIAEGEVGLALLVGIAVGNVVEA